jgi:hypothetical protein
MTDLLLLLLLLPLALFALAAIWRWRVTRFVPVDERVAVGDAELRLHNELTPLHSDTRGPRLHARLRLHLSGAVESRSEAISLAAALRDYAERLPAGKPSALSRKTDSSRPALPPDPPPAA